MLRAMKICLPTVTEKYGGHPMHEKRISKNAGGVVMQFCCMKVDILCVDYSPNKGEKVGHLFDIDMRCLKRRGNLSAKRNQTPKYGRKKACATVRPAVQKNGGAMRSACMIGVDARQHVNARQSHEEVVCPG